MSPFGGMVALSKVKRQRKCFYQMPKLIDVGEEPLLMEKKLVRHPEDKRTKQVIS
jgi:hypothetical protein